MTALPLLSDEDRAAVVLAARQAIRDSEGCGYTLSDGERVYCTDARLADDLRMSACTCETEAEAALTAALPIIERCLAPEGWQDISTAPRDWSDILLYDPEQDREVFEGYFSCDDGGSNEWLTAANQPCCPVRWRPLPEPPTLAEEVVAR